MNLTLTAGCFHQLSRGRRSKTLANAFTSAVHTLRSRPGHAMKALGESTCGGLRTQRARHSMLVLHLCPRPLWSLAKDSQPCSTSSRDKDGQGWTRYDKVYFVNNRGQGMIRFAGSCCFATSRSASVLLGL